MYFENTFNKINEPNIKNNKITLNIILDYNNYFYTLFSKKKVNK